MLKRMTRPWVIENQVFVFTREFMVMKVSVLVLQSRDHRSVA
jgi:hypothetical protein